jgi:hypothetical protein
MKKIFWFILFVLLISVNIYLYNLNSERKANIENNENFSLDQTNRDNTINHMENSYIIIIIMIAVIIILAFLFFIIKKGV